MARHYEASPMLRAAISQALHQALEMVADDEFVPFISTEGAIHALDPAHWPEMAVDVIATFSDAEPFWVLVAPELEPEAVGAPAFHVRAGERGDADALMFEQHYRAAGWLRGPALVGDLVCIGDCENPM